MRGRSSKKPEAYWLEYVGDLFGPSTTKMPADRLPQQNGLTRTDFYETSAKTACRTGFPIAMVSADFTQR